MPEESKSIRLPDTSKLLVSSSPHVRAKGGIPQIMFLVLLALVPCVLAGTWIFGPRALWVVFTTTVAAVAVEALCNRIMHDRLSIGDGSAAVTGMILALTLPPVLPTWVGILGSAIAIILGKMVYGGLGFNPFNPAMVARCALLLALPALMTHFTDPTVPKPKEPLEKPAAIVERFTENGGAIVKMQEKAEEPQGGLRQRFSWTPLDAVSEATPITYQKQKDIPREADGYVITTVTPRGLRHHIRRHTCWDLFIGNYPGCVGETSKLAILIGGLFLLALGIIRWQVPVFYIGTFAIITEIAHHANPSVYPPALVASLSGGVFFGAFFMATDMVTTPLTRKGAVVFAIGCGIINAVIRLWGTYPEGVTFAILLMNALTPLIDRYTAGHPFGFHKKEAVKA